MWRDKYSHRRFNPLTGEWILVSPHRTRRPWQGQEEAPEPETRPEYDPDCYLCPGNIRAGGAVNPDYKNTFVFTNDFSALSEETPVLPGSSSDGLLTAEPETGLCRVICYSPRHDLSLARMETSAAAVIVEAWSAEYTQLGGQPDINYVQIFENRGPIMGCSNPHPHGQIWANRTVPFLPALEGRQQVRYLQENGHCLLCRYLEQELARNERLVLENDSFVVLVPFWAVWPFEVMIVSREHKGALSDMTDRQRVDLAEVLIRLTVRYDNLFRTAFPYSMGLHQQPTEGRPHPEWHFHIHYYPPLLRSRSIRKFMVGYELLAMPQRDITPEESARRMQSMSEVHYLDQAGWS